MYRGISRWKRAKNRKLELIRMTSSNERREQLCIDLMDYKRYLNSNIRLSCRNFQILLPWKSTMAEAAIFSFVKCHYRRTGWSYLHHIWWQDASTPSGDDYVTWPKKRNWKLIRVTSSNKLWKRKYTYLNFTVNFIRFFGIGQRCCPCCSISHTAPTVKLHCLTLNKKLSCRRETARRFLSLNILLSHSMSLKVIQNDTVE